MYIARGLRVAFVALTVCGVCRVATASVMVDKSTAKSSSLTPEPSAAVSLSWLNDLDQGLALASVEYRPVLLFFSSPDCGWCKRLKTHVLQDPALAKLLGQFIRVELDAGTHREAASQYGVRGVPALRLLRADGWLQNGVDGYLDATRLRELLEASLNPDLVRDMKASARDVLKLLDGATVDPADWPAILEAFGNDDLKAAIREAVMQLTPFPGHDLVAMLSHPRLAVRTGAIDLLEELAGNTFAFDPWRGIAEPQTAALKRWQDWASGMTGKVETVYASLDAASIARHVQDLISDDRDRALRAMRLLGQGGEGVVPALADVLANADDLDAGARMRIREVQYTLLLPQNGSLPPEETAHRLLFGNPDVRLRTLASLKTLGEKALPILREFLTDPDPMVRETAVDTILVAGQRMALSAVSRLLQTETNRHVKHAALRGLGKVRSRAAMLLLVPYVTDADENLAMAALESLSRLDYKDPVDALKTALADSRWRVRAAALDTAGKLDMAALGDAVIERLRVETDPFVRVTAIDTLAALEARQSEPVLKTLFQQDDALKGPVIAAYAAMELPIPDSFIAAVKRLSGDALLSVVQILPDTGKQGLPLAAELATHQDLDIACAALRLIGKYVATEGQYMSLAADALRSGAPEKQLAVLEAVNSRGSYSYYGDNDARVDFDTIVKPPVVPDPPQTKAPAGDSAVDDLLAAFADPGQRTPSTPSTTNAAEPSAVDDLFGEFAAAAEAVDATDPGATGQVALVTTADAAPTTGKSGDLLKGLVSLFSPGAARTRPREPTVSWTEFGDRAADLLAVEDSAVRLAAALWLGSKGDTRAIPVLVADPASRTSEQRVKIARMLGRIPDRDGFDQLVAFLNDSDGDVRKEAVSSLFGSRIGLERIFALLQAPDSRLKAADVVVTDMASPRPMLKDYLRDHALELLTSSTVEAKQNIGLILLADVGDSRDRDTLETFLEASSAYQRRAAWFALSRVDRSRFELLMAKAAADKSAAVRNVIPAVYARSYSSWVHFLDADTPVRSRFSSSYTSIRSGRASTLSETARTVLAGLGEDADAGVRFAALFSLLVNRQSLDLQDLIDAAGALPDRKAASQRITNFMMMNLDELGPGLSALLPLVEASSYSESSLERLRTRLVSAAGEAASGSSPSVIFRTPARQGNDEQDSPELRTAGTQTSPAIHAVFFTKPGCHECQRVAGMLRQLRASLPELTVETFEIGQPSAMRLNQVLCRRLRAPTGLAGVTPAVFAGGGYLIRDGFSLDALGSLLAVSRGIPRADWRTVSEADEGDADVAIAERFSEISIFLLLAYALSDSVNPCAFAAIIFFISYLQITRRTPREIAQVALAFIIGVFLTYLVLGFGIGEALARLAALQRAGMLLNALMALLTLVLAILNLNDARLCAAGRMEAMTLQLPGLLKRRIHGVIRGNARHSAFVLAAFATGIMISILELACTGQAYLPAIHYMLRDGGRIWDAAGYLVLYNLAFVAPLCVIFGLVYRGMRSERLILWLRQHAAMVKLVSAILFMVLFVILLNRHVIPDLQAWLQQ